MSKDTFKLVTEFPITEYRCGARAGERVRLRRELAILDHRDRPTGKIHAPGEIWTVVRGAAEEPRVLCFTNRTVNRTPGTMMPVFGIGL